MHILITGAAGMIGRKLTARLLADGALRGRAIERLTLHDVVPFPTDALGKPSAAIDTAASDLAVVRWSSADLPAPWGRCPSLGRRAFQAQNPIG